MEIGRQVIEDFIEPFDVTYEICQYRFELGNVYLENFSQIIANPSPLELFRGGKLVTFFNGSR